MSESRTIAVLGGSGQQGRGLALRWASAGYEVLIGSRTPDKAQIAAREIQQRLGRPATVKGMSNLDAARGASIIVLAVPYAAQQPTADEVRALLDGKLLIDVTVPLVPPRVDRVQLPDGQSAVAALQQRLGPSVTVVSAFQNVAASHLWDLDHAIECDVLVCADDAKARERVIELARAAGMRALHAGALVNSAVAEALTSVLIALNKRYKIPGAGIRITGIPDA